MSDARWFEVQADVEAAVRHFRQSIELYRKGGFDASGLDGYQAEMALMHALQSAHTSLESGFLRILEMLGEERPVGENWHADLITRVSAVLPGRRPAIISKQIAEAATETRRFRHRATHNYDSFRVEEVSRTIEAAAVLAGGLEADILAFRTIIDPPENERRE
jgi:uncharacterized protein YutE (UPF0331/DUF86 family)